MKVFLKLDSNVTQIEQMAQAFEIEMSQNQLIIDGSIGKGFISYYSLPYQIQVHHYQYQLNKLIEVQSENAIDNGLFIIQVNLSHRLLKKSLNEKTFHLTNSKGSGTLFYSPGYSSRGRNEIDQQFEVLFFGFPRTTLPFILAPGSFAPIFELEKFCIYDELPASINQKIESWLNLTTTESNGLIGKGLLLQILGNIIEHFSNRSNIPSSRLKLNDIERQMVVKEILLNNIFGKPPTLESIAKELKISVSKLKNDFKSVFGQPIYQYYLENKMKMAKNLLIANHGTVSEIGYQLGYTNISQFAAQFKKHFGVTPSQIL